MIRAGWYGRVIDRLAQMALVPHAFGVSDCLCDLATLVEEIHGVDYAAPYRGRYSTYDEGVALLQADGYAEPVDLVARHFPEVAVIDARSGDIGALTNEQGHLGFGMFIRDRLYVKLPTGLGRLPRSSAERAFKVT